MYRVSRKNGVSSQSTILKQLASQTFETMVSISGQNPDSDVFKKMMALTFRVQNCRYILLTQRVVLSPWSRGGECNLTAPTSICLPSTTVSWIAESRSFRYGIYFVRCMKMKFSALSRCFSEGLMQSRYRNTHQTVRRLQIPEQTEKVQESPGSVCDAPGVTCGIRSRGGRARGERES